MKKINKVGDIYKSGLFTRMISNLKQKKKLKLQKAIQAESEKLSKDKQNVPEKDLSPKDKKVSIWGRLKSKLMLKTKKKQKTWGDLFLEHAAKAKKQDLDKAQKLRKKLEEKTQRNQLIQDIDQILFKLDESDESDDSAKSLVDKEKNKDLKKLFIGMFNTNVDKKLVVKRRQNLDSHHEQLSKQDDTSDQDDDDMALMNFNKRNKTSIIDSQVKRIAMKQLLSQVETNKVPFLLKLSNNLVCIFICLLTIYGYFLHHKVTEIYKNIIPEVVKCNKFQRYSHQMFGAMNSYQFLYINSKGYLDDSIYTNQWFERELLQNQNYFSNITDLLTIDAFSEESLTTSNSFWLYWSDYYYFLNPNKTLGELNMNFHSFSRFFLNALKETSLYTPEQYSDITIDENLVILNQNFDQISTLLNNFLDILLEDYINTKIEIIKFYLQVSYYISLGIIIIMIIIVFPILLQSRKAIERVLVLFTTINRNQVYHYYLHFYHIVNAFANFKEIERLGEIGKQMTNKEAQDKEDKLYKRDAQTNTVTKRRFKNLKFNYLAFFLTLLIIGAFFFVFLLFKDYTQLENTKDIYEAIKQTINLNKVSMKVEELYYIFNELKIKSYDESYKQHQKLSVQQQKYNELSEELIDLMALIQNEGEIITFDEKRNKILKDLIRGNLCQKGGFNQAQQEECTVLRKNQLTHGYNPFVVDLLNKFQVDLDSIRMSDNEEQDSFIINMWNKQDSIEVNYAMRYFQDVSSIEAQSFQDIIIERIGVIEQQSLYFFWTLIVLLITFYFCLWKRSFIDLANEAIRLNKYLVIIPLRLMKNNHNIKVHMMKYLRVNINNLV